MKAKASVIVLSMLLLGCVHSANKIAPSTPIRPNLVCFCCKYLPDHLVDRKRITCEREQTLKCIKDGGIPTAP